MENGDQNDTEKKSKSHGVLGVSVFDEIKNERCEYRQNQTDIANRVRYFNCIMVKQKDCEQEEIGGGKQIKWVFIYHQYFPELINQMVDDASENCHSSHE